MRRLIPAVLCGFLAAGLLAGPAASAETAAAPAAEPAAPESTFTSLAPLRVLDTRNGTGVSGAVGPGGTITLDLTARVPADATAVVLNVTGVQPTAATHVSVFPAGTPRPGSSNLNLPAGDIRANQVTIALGTNRSVSFFNNSGNIHLVADLAGYYGTGDGAKFTPLPPKRTLDTRLNGGPLGAGVTRVVDLADSIPASATSVTFNLTATNVTASTFVTAWPTGTTRPTASSLNLPAGDTRPNLVTVAVGTDRKVSLYNLAGSVELIVDVSGFYTNDYGSLFLPLKPKRVLDTRFGTGTGGVTTPVGPDGFLHLNLVGELPATSTGVALNLTGVDATAPTVVTAWAPVGDVPSSSTLNLAPGQAVPNAAVVSFVFEPGVALHNLAGSVHLVADLAGVFVQPELECEPDCVYGWGTHTGYASSSPLPTPVAALPEVRAVASSGGTTYLLGADGKVRAWGDNGYGQLGNGWTTGQFYGGSPVPVPVLGLTNVTAIAARGRSAYALRADGTVWAWGANYFGQLGTGNVNQASVPVQVSGLTGVTAIGAGDDNGYAVRADGTLWSWGNNGGGHLGNGSDVAYSTTPVQVPLTDVVAVAGGGHSNGTYAVREDGTVWAWGYNFSGALGHGQPCAPDAACLSKVPVQVSGLTGVTAVASGVYNGMALREDGTVWTWGTNDRGQLGNGVECDYAQDPNTCVAYAPVQVANLSDVTQIGAFYGGGYALREDGTVWSWGTNFSGTLGNDTVPDHTTVPVPVLNLADVSDLGNSGSGGFAVVPTT